MRTTRPGLPLLLSVCCLLLASTDAGARHRHGHGTSLPDDTASDSAASTPGPSATKAVAGQFDYFLFSLSIAPSFCALTPANQAKQECQSLTEADFQRTPLTIHGLWPNRAHVGVNRQPQDCDGPPFAVSGSVQADLRRYMPGGPGMERYEWRKHGTCSGIAPDAYFAAMVRLSERANAIIGAAIRDHMADRTVKIADLRGAVAAEDRALASAMVVDCRHARGGEALVEEIRLVLSKDFAPTPAADVGLGQNSGCPQGAGRIPAVPGR